MTIDQQSSNESAPSNAHQVEAFAGWFNELLTNVESVIKGKRDEVAMALVCVFAEGHLLLEDVPGTGKTVLAKSIANSVEGTWSRVQFTPDLLPSDVTGGLVFNQNDGEFELHKGPVFSNVVLADEINRASPKTQAALLEVMEERHVTIGTETHNVPRPFVVIATQNPVEQAGTYRLPEAQLDRFLMRTSLGYPDEASEIDVLKSSAAGASAETLSAIMQTDGIRKMIGIAADVHLDDQIHAYIVRLVTATRELPELRLGVSTRGAIALMRAARSLAASQGREYVTADDVKMVAPPVMAHRMLLTPDSELKRIDSLDLVRQVLDSVETPAAVRAG